MAIKVATLAVDVTVSGVARALAGLKGLEDKATALGKKLKGTTEGVVKTWAAFNLLTSSSAIASVYVGAFQQAFGSLIDTILIPILPILDALLDGFFAFSDWFQNQGPFVHAVMLGLMVAGALMWLGVGGPLAIAIAGFVAFGYWFVNSGPVVQGILAALAVAFGIFWFAATGGILPLIAGLILIVGWMLKVTGLWDKVKGAATWVGEKLGIISPDSGTAGASDGSSTSGIASGAGVGSYTSMNTTTNYNIGLSTYGGDAGGRDAGLSLQNHMALANRSV